MSLSSIFKSIFGGTDTSGQDRQYGTNELLRGLIMNQADVARGDLMGAYPGASQAINQGAQSAMDLWGQILPQQIGAVQQGGQEAQRFMLGGLPYIQRAIMGAPMNLENIVPNVRPGMVSPNLSFASQQLPQGVANPQFQSGQTRPNPFVSPDYLKFVQSNPLGGIR